MPLIMQRLPDNFVVDPYRRRLYAALQEHRDTQCPGENDAARIIQFIELLCIVRKLPAGDYVELGTFQGGTARWISHVMRPETHLYCFDTFDGFLQPDMDIERRYYFDHQWTRTSFEPVNIHDVRRTIEAGTDRPDRIHLVKGPIQETLPEHEGLSVRFGHIDMDLYEPTQIAIKWLWPKMVPGGFVVFHDYGSPSMPGVRAAVHEYFGPLGIAGIPMGDACGSLVVAKPGVV